MPAKTILLLAWLGPCRQFPALGLFFPAGSSAFAGLCWKVCSTPCPSGKPSLFKAQLRHHLQEASPPCCSSAPRIPGTGCGMSCKALLAASASSPVPSRRIQKVAQPRRYLAPHTCPPVFFRPLYLLSSPPLPGSPPPLPSGLAETPPPPESILSAWSQTDVPPLGPSPLEEPRACSLLAFSNRNHYIDTTIKKLLHLSLSLTTQTSNNIPNTVHGAVWDTEM